MGAIDFLNRDMKILIQESYRRGAEITQRNPARQSRKLGNFELRILNFELLKSQYSKMV